LRSPIAWPAFSPSQLQWGPEISTLVSILTQEFDVSVPSALGLPVEAVSPSLLRLPDQISGAGRVRGYGRGIMGWRRRCL
jgi:hypothetical protein